MNEIKKEKETINEMLMRRARNMSTYLENMLKWCFLALFTHRLKSPYRGTCRYPPAFLR